MLKTNDVIYRYSRYPNLSLVVLIGTNDGQEPQVRLLVFSWPDLILNNVDHMEYSGWNLEDVAFIAKWHRKINRNTAANWLKRKRKEVDRRL